MQLAVLDRLRLPGFTGATFAARLARWGLGISLIYVLIAIAAPLLQAWGWLQNPTEALLNPIHAAPSWQHWFGTTRQGYDVFSRTLFGTRVALQVVLLGTSLSLVIGVPLGLIAGYWGGWLDRALVFLMDVIYTLPGLLLSITLAFVVGRGVPNAAIALSIAYVPQYFRVVRNQTASVKSEPYIEAARSLGASTPHILRKYLVANVIQSVPVLFTLNAADAVLILGGLGFLGLGLPEAVPEWGYDLRQALDALPTGIWWTALFPGLAMTLLVVALSLLGEGLGETLQPKRR
ncbi:ABC transporter permease [Synechococcus elongatus]|uniref:Oligopeptides ABC transporter permease protein n=2 Tax=Synechococcus elongatus TaxID=32046 RepID=A0A0H3K809_SYNP6|nr:ABC transporter permease [Synechococcus elongatus]ABB58082.1 probable oligopeptides ABC transporter permease protein [Synechococcus elongatus PCC 7942 = FACHB-805]AJD57441.1 peptide ABC transporter permease [Synechococcus elongatus UTEX 2973]MBD2586801.1 ABC transporter permease [Synechococcus elongatus FACHB-242]MBD2687872.1 ABC transporter permease [Synechococcus elongatus FACHB-1061]MBD2706417.1 ABC transporter permease [Synechococcus elongatus PCC 7942 = FACHB-805]